jgi:hypothetical protein
MRGGSFANSPSQLAAAQQGTASQSIEASYIGFRIATVVPEPSTGLLVIAGLVGLGVRRRISA